MNSTSQNLDNQTVLDLLREIGDEEGLEEIRFEILGRLQKGDNFLGEVTPVRIVGKNGKIDVIIKVASQSEALRQCAPINCLYDREIYIYTSLVPDFKNFEKSKGIPNSLDYIAKCYKSSSIPPNEILIFENLKSKGFQMLEKRKPLNFEHAKLVLEHFAKWHALSYAYSKQLPDKYNQIKEKLQFDIMAVLYKSFDSSNIFLKECKIMIDSFDQGKDKKYIDFLKKCCENVDNFMKVVGEIDEYSVLLHGDAWNNNILFKYSDPKNSKKPTEMCLVDFQLIRLGSPVIDLTNFLYSSCEKEVFTNLNECMNIYYNALTRHLKKLGTNIEDVLPLSVYENLWKKYSKWGLMIAIAMIKIMLADQTEAVNLHDATDAEEVRNSFDYEISNMEEYKSRIMDIVRHYVDDDVMIF